MTENPITLASSATIGEAVKLFTEKKISSVPVYAATGEIIGQLTDLGLVRALVLHQLQPEKYSRIAHCGDLLDPVTFVAPTDSIIVLMKAIMKSPNHRVLVRESGIRAIGIVSPKDLMIKLVTSSPDVHHIHKAVQSITT